MLSSSLRRASARGTDTSLIQVRRASTRTRKKSADLVRRDTQKIIATSKHLIEGAKQADNPEWRHIYGRKGAAKRLEQDLLAKKGPLLRDGQSNPSILTAQSIDKWTVEDFLQSGTSVLQPGTYIELRRNVDSVNGIVLGSAVRVGYNEDTITLTTRGEVVLHRSADAMFAIPNFIDSYLIERCGTVQDHEDQHQLSARLRVLKSARDFERAVEKEQYRYGRAIRDIYPQVRASSPDEWGKVTTMQVARMLDATPNVPIVTLMAVHRQLMDRADEFVCHPSRHRFVHTFDVRPFSHLRNIEHVKQMVRDKSPVLRNFQKKTKVLIDRSRDLAKESIGEAPSRVEVVDMNFSAEEQEIITFLKLSMNQTRRIQRDSYEGNAPHILMDTFRYEELITSYTTLRFLREIGVLTPWEDLASKDKDLQIHTIHNEPLAHPVMPAVVDSAALTSGTKTSGLLTRDPHESVRHDFGDLPVYVIDDLSAEELDDGVSVEAAPGEPDTTWLHVHVADPTAVVPITHPLSQQIQKQTETYYFGHQSWPMLPDDVAAQCDMGRGGVRETGQNVLTFSAKIGPTGQILDYKVCASRVRNVHKLQYDDVNKVLLPELQPPWFAPFEPDITLSSETRDISYILPHVENLKLAFDVSRRLVEDRSRRDIFTYSMNNAAVVFLDKPVLQSDSRAIRPILHRGYPRLRYMVTRTDTSESGSRGVIAECMKIASRIASRFCLERNIPAIRRAMPSIELESDKLSRILAQRDNCGYVHPTCLAREGVTLPSSILTTQPSGHWALGVPDGEGYVRTTSPLRRAEDMIMHWQIKSALLPGGGRLPPIDDAKLVRMLEDLNGRKQVVKKAYRAHTRQWTHTYIQRFMEEQERAGTTMSESNTLRGLEGYIMQSPVYNTVRWSYYQDVLIPKLGLTGVLPTKAGADLPVGERIKVNVSNIFAYDLNQTLEVELA